jgi:integrase/recombinase XerD
MKVNRNGQAEILSRDRLADLFNVMSGRYRLLFGICYFTGCRIAEAIQLKRGDVGGSLHYLQAHDHQNSKDPHCQS